jgi:hypothetical protein
MTVALALGSDTAGKRSSDSFLQRDSADRKGDPSGLPQKRLREPPPFIAISMSGRLASLRLARGMGRCRQACFRR